ncbi:Eco57I restriction-modification methylase domain-containing protein [Candidatus Poribacteria bacterium]|nr:Eco57I restriction-modification methylase domain-containing protein [Candidatus Poribacteria bacterium]
MITESAVRSIQGFDAFLDFLRRELFWPIPEGPLDVEDVTYDFSPDELNLDEAARRRLRDDCIRQLMPFTPGQPWGIFLVELHEPKVYTTFLRRLLRRLVPNRRTASHLRGWDAENLLFICTPDYRSFTFAHFTGDQPHTAKLATFSWSPEEPVRTLCEFNLPALRLTDLDLFGEPDHQEWLSQWKSAFDVEKVTQKFFNTYKEIFERTERLITGIEDDAKRLFTQKIFNRLLFVRFLEKKGWLEFNARRDYLRALSEDYRQKRDSQANFYRERLELLFFSGLNTPHNVNLIGINRGGFLKQLIGGVPFLNGGLFERDETDRNAGMVVPDNALEPALNDLFYAFNFTVMETTPLDIEVAVDPEMLGKIFEELVTGRHESGSYYTPKPVVSFMCREALKGYLQTTCPKEHREAIAQFVDEHNGGGLRQPERVLGALRAVTVCDPACGSGAYLLGMLHELLDLREALFAAHRLDAHTVYERKLEIIENNLYGVDLDPFAINIARLRLWLSLVVDFEDDDPPPLPNLDFKVEVGDSLTAPNPQGMTQQAFRDKLVLQFREKKAEYMRVYHYGEKQQLRSEITQLREGIAGWTHSGESTTGFDWGVEFAEVFAQGGFDIVLANPPYLRQEVVKRQFGDAYKDQLVALYPEAFVKTADIYVAFYARAHQLLKQGGVGCFISSNKWLRAGYGEKLRQHLLDSQAFHLVVDFGELPVFQAATFPAIFLWQKQPRFSRAPSLLSQSFGRGDGGEGISTTWAVVKDLQACYDEGIREHVACIAQTVPASQFGVGKPRLAAPTAADRRAKMEASGPRLGELVRGQINCGIKTGLNEAFIVDRPTRDRLTIEDPKSAEILKLLLVGDDVRRYELHFREAYLIWAYIGVPIKRYPAIFTHLKQFQAKAEKRWDQGNHWWELRACDYYDIFDRPKIIYPQIMMEPRFCMDTENYFTNQKCFIIPDADWYLLGILNSALAWEYLQGQVVTFGDPDKRGRLEPRKEDILSIPIPGAPMVERETVAELAQESQRLHKQRRNLVEQFLCDIGISPAQSSSRNPLEQPWTLTKEALQRRIRSASCQLAFQVRDETAALTEQIAQGEREIDERVAGLYGVVLEKTESV